MSALAVAKSIYRSRFVQGARCLLLLALVTLSALHSSVSMAWKPPPAAPSVETLLSKAEAGDVKALTDLGFRYLRGDGVTRNYAEALKWFLRAGDQGNAAAKWAAGEIIYRGLSGPTDTNRGLTLIREAADADQVNAFYAMGDRYFQAGRYREAIPWFERAASRGYGFIYRKLALMHLHGIGTEQDDRAAAGQFCLAAYRGDAPAIAFLAGMYLKGRGVTKNERLADVLWRHARYRGIDFSETAFAESIPGESDARVVEKLLLAPEQEYPKTAYSLGMAYMHGRGVMRNDELAAKFFSDAATAGHIDAKFQFAQLLVSDRNEFTDRGQVRELLRSAAEQGHLRATIQLGVDLHRQATAESQGAVVARFQGREWQSLSDQSKKNIDEALKWMTIATQQGNAYAYAALASFYGEGPAGAPRALPVDLALQSKYLKLAAQQGEVWSQHRIGVNLLHGSGVDKNVDEAMRWLALAARQQAVFGFYPVTDARKRLSELGGRVDGLERADGGEACSHVAFR